MFTRVTSGFSLGLPPLRSRFQGSLLGRSWWLAQGEPAENAHLYRGVEQAILKSCGDVQAMAQAIIAALPLATVPLDDVLLALVPLILYGHDAPQRLKSAIASLSPSWPAAQARVLPGWAELLVA
ncbi:MAG: hypothetical protein ACPGVO_00245, partial [Spirulinaceae cyanobacterium]